MYKQVPRAPKKGDQRVLPRGRERRLPPAHRRRRRHAVIYIPIYVYVYVYR